MFSYTAGSLKSELNSKGWRLTPQREVILQVFQNLPRGNHLSAEELHVLLVKRGEKVSLSTVYRTVKLMTRMGILRELELAEGHKHYELNSPSPHHHHHLVCVQCNRTIEFENDSIWKQGLKQVDRAGFQMIDCQLTIYTICPEAVRMGWPASVPSHWVCSRSLATMQPLDSLDSLDSAEADSPDAKEPHHAAHSSSTPQEVNQPS